MKSWFFIGDAHLSDDDPGRQALLIRFLEENRDRMERLVILGDLFEFWFGFQGYIDPAYRPLCDTLVSLTRSGIPLIYLEGNHDFALGPFFKETLGAEVYPGSHTLDIHGQRVFLAHGDGLARGDFLYRFWRGLLKNRACYGIIRRLGPERTHRLKNLISRRSWMHRRRAFGQGECPDERFARDRCLEGADVVVLGHTHQPCEKTFRLSGRTCYYFNVGDWMKHFSYLQYRPDKGFRLAFYPPGEETAGRDETLSPGLPLPSTESVSTSGERSDR